VFTGLRGDPLAPDRLTRTFRRLTVEAGMPPIRLHDLRHGAATLALSAGVALRVAQDMLGHCSIVLTANTRTSVLPDVAHRRRSKSPPWSCAPGSWYPAPAGRVDRPASPDGPM
jgi:integrase